MSRFLIAVSSMFAAGAAFAGGLSDSIVEATPETAQTVERASSAPSWVVPLVIVGLLVAVAVSSSSGSGSSYDY